MWIRTSSVLLATLVVSGLSFPRPDKEYKIPAVGSGPRSQYYVLHSDGTFKYGFDTGKGAFESVKSHTLGSRDGEFGYVDPDGKTIRLEYEAGEGGFVARGDHLPKPSPELAQALAAVVRRSRPFIDPLADHDSDASYGFRFHSDVHSRDEKSDSDGTVTGSYSYVDENGVTRSFTYRAGKGIGFVIEGDGLTQDVRAPTPTVKKAPVRTFPKTPTQPQHAFGTGSTRKIPTPSRPVGAAFRTSTGYSGQQANIAASHSQVPGDASYRFSYDAGDHSRSETSDKNLNVDGTFSFVADDGNKRTLNYVAGSATGFQAEGDHLPKAPEVEFGGRFSLTPASRKQSESTLRHSGASQVHGSRGLQHKITSKTTPVHGQTSAHLKSSFTGSYPQHPSTRGLSHKTTFKSATAISKPIGAYEHKTAFRTTGSQQVHTPSKTTRSQATIKTGIALPGLKRPFEEANIRSSLTPAGPYTFSYETSGHSRSESGDDDNNVVGNFAFIADDDGERREITYEAGSATGFIAEGAHLPVGPDVPGAPSGQPTGRLIRVSTAPFVDPLAGSDGDASYHFAFDSDTYSRSESADEDGNIIGTYTIVEEDGTRITYRFKAGKGIGFETEEISRVQGPRPAKPTPYSGPLADPSLFKISPKTSLTAGTGVPLQLKEITRKTGHSHTRHSSIQTGRTATVKSGITTHKSQPAYVRKVTPSTKTSFQQTSRTQTGGSFTPPQILKSAFTPARTHEVFPGFTLHSYDPSPSAEKFGYVLKFDD